MDLERRYSTFFDVDRCRLVRAGRGGAPRLAGHAAVFNQLSRDLGGFRERIQPGAFAESIATGDVLAFWSHDSGIVLGRTSSGTLRLHEDALGLGFELDLPDTTGGRDALELIARGDVSQMSFGFRVPPGGDEWNKTGQEAVRVLKTVELVEVSPVAQAAYPQTDIAMRSLARWQSSPTHRHRRQQLALLELVGIVPSECR